MSNSRSSEVFSRRLVQQVMNPPLPPEVWIGKKSFLLPMMQRWLPTRLRDRILAKRFGLTSDQI